MPFSRLKGDEKKRALREQAGLPRSSLDSAWGATLLKQHLNPPEILRCVFYNLYKATIRPCAICSDTLYDDAGTAMTLGCKEQFVVTHCSAVYDDGAMQ